MAVASDVRSIPVITELGYGSPARYLFRGRYIFDSIPLEDSRVLEIGCGRGAWAIFAGLSGARFALGLEPEMNGSSNGTLTVFRKVIYQLGLENTVEASPLPFQALDHHHKQFDVVVMYNVINHINEDAVRVLDFDPAAQSAYLAELRAIRQLVAPGGWLILADAARSNLWGSLGMRSPFARTLVWCKHQNPEVWTDLCARAGFTFHDLRWSPIYPFGRLLAHRLGQWLTMSHFVLRLRRPENPLATPSAGPHQTP